MISQLAPAPHEHPPITTTDQKREVVMLARSKSRNKEQ